MGKINKTLVKWINCKANLFLFAKTPNLFGLRFIGSQLKIFYSARSAGYLSIFNKIKVINLDIRYQALHAVAKARISKWFAWRGSSLLWPKLKLNTRSPSVCEIFCCSVELYQRHKWYHFDGSLFLGRTHRCADGNGLLSSPPSMRGFGNMFIKTYSWLPWYPSCSWPVSQPIWL